MSVNESYATNMEMSSLKPHPSIEKMLHHPYQNLRLPPGASRMDIRYLSFDSPDFGQRQEIQIPAFPLTVHDMYLEVSVSAANNDVANTLPYWVPTPCWLTANQGADLNFHEISVYNATESEILMSTILDNYENQFQARQRLFAFNQANSTANTAQILYLPLQPLAEQFLSRCGPLSSYPSNSFSVSVDLRAVGNLIRNGAASANTQSATMNSMSLVLIGTIASEEEVVRTREALNSSGIMFNFLRSYHFRDTLSDNGGSSSSYSRIYSSVVGALSQARLLIRNKSTWDTSNNQLVNPVDYQTYYGTTDYINAGRSGNPFDVWNEQLSLPIVYNLFSCRGTKGSSRYVALPQDLTPVGVDTGIITIEFGETEGGAIEWGLSDGSYNVRNDFEVDLTIATDTVQDNYLDSVLYVYQKCIITSAVAVINLSS